MALKYLSGSWRRLIAFVLTLAVLACAGFLHIDGGVAAAITALALGYIGQGAVKEITSGIKGL